MPRIKSTVHNYQKDDTDPKAVTKKALYATAIGTAGAYLLFNERGNVDLLNMPIPTSLGAGLACAAGSVAGDLLSGLIIDKLDQSTAMKTTESEIVKLAVSAGAAVGTMSVVYGFEPSLNGALLGGASKFGADSIYNQYDPNLLGMLW